MFAIFQKHESTNEDDSINDSPQALIIRSVFESGDDFGSEDELNSLRQLEDNLDRIFADNNYDLDGQAQRGRQQAQPKKLSPKEQQALKDGPNKRNMKDYKSAKNKTKYNQKISGERKSRESKDKNNRGPKGGASAGGGGPSIRLPSSQDVGKAAAVIGGAIVVGVGIWWSAKIASPACGPGILVCAVVL